MNPEQNYSPGRDRARPAGQLRQGRLRRPARARARGEGRRPGAAAGRSPARLVRHRGPVRRPGPAAGDQPDASIGRRSPSSRAAARSAGPPATAGARSSSRRSRWRRCRRSLRAGRVEARGRVDRRGSSRPGRGDRRRPAVPRPAAQAKLTAGRTLLLAAAAAAAGIGIGLVDSSPGWDSTGITAGALVIAAAAVAWIGRDRPWLWAALVGLPTPIIDIARTGNTGSVLALGFAALGAAVGWGLRRAG